jgi:hypothetical protein
MNDTFGNSLLDFVQKHGKRSLKLFWYWQILLNMMAAIISVSLTLNNITAFNFFTVLSRY